MKIQVNDIQMPDNSFIGHYSRGVYQISILLIVLFSFQSVSL